MADDLERRRSVSLVQLDSGGTPESISAPLAVDDDGRLRGEVEPGMYELLVPEHAD